MKYSYWDNKLTVDDIDVEAAVRKVQELLAQEQNVPPALHSTLDELVAGCSITSDRLGLNSRNSSKPPSSDHNRPRDKSSQASSRKPGGQPGRVRHAANKASGLPSFMAEKSRLLNLKTAVDILPEEILVCVMPCHLLVPQVW